MAENEGIIQRVVIEHSVVTGWDRAGRWELYRCDCGFHLADCGRELVDWPQRWSAHVATAITAALGDGAIVVDKGRLRAAWDRNISCNRPKPCDICDLHFGRWLAALTAPEVEA